MLYATLATLGLLARVGVLPLPEPLHLLMSWWVIGVSVALFLVEFFADKVPAFDLLWNALHTFIRVRLPLYWPTAPPLSFPPGSSWSQPCWEEPSHWQLTVGKTAVRAAITPSPEPLSNIGLSLGEDALAIFLTWFSTRHPYIAASLAILFIIVIVLLARWVVRALKSLFRGAEGELAHHGRPS